MKINNPITIQIDINIRDREVRYYMSIQIIYTNCIVQKRYKKIPQQNNKQTKQFVLPADE